MVDRMRILLVDDQPQFAELAKLSLQREDDRFDIVTATSPTEGIDRLTESEFDCIVSDYDMPETSGLEFFEAVRAREIDLPFIVFSGKNEEDLHDEPRFAAVTAYLQKGGRETFQDLARRIRLAISEYRSNRALIDVQDRYDALFEQTSLGIAWIVQNGHKPYIADCNQRFSREFIGDTNNSSNTPLESTLDHVEFPIDVIEESLQAGQPAKVRAERIDGSNLRQYQLQIIPVEDTERSGINHGLIAANDITDTATREHELELYRTIVEASGDPMYVLDIAGRFTYVNDAFVELSGYEREELLGTNGRFVMSEEDYMTGTRLIRSLLSSDRESDTFEMELQTATGDAIPCENHITLIYDVETGNGDKAKGTAGVIRDISEQKRRTEKLRRHNERLEEFAGFISHDLRNPINTATGYLELARDRVECPEHEAIDRSLLRMQELVDDLLVMARSEQHVVEPEPVELAQAARKAWRHVETGDATLRIEANPTLMADESRTRQLFENIFANAIEHGNPEGVITVGAIDGGIFIEDDGPGIPLDQREAIFGYGYSTNESGTGFGLSIVQQIVDIHGWEIAVKSSTAGGARFEITDVAFSDPAG